MERTTTDAPDIRIDPTVTKPKFDRRAHCQQIGSKGGRATVDKYGVAHMKMLGKLGLRAYADKYHDGQIAAAVAGLRKAKPGTFSN